MSASNANATRVAAAVRHAACSALAAIIGSLLFPSVAAAHVNAKATQVTDDGIVTVEFTFDHGCQGRPTNALRVQIPSNVADVTPQAQPGWVVDLGTDQFGWSGGSVPDRQRITFTATMRVWGKAGETIWLKTIQQCGDLEEAWVEVPAPGAAEPPNVAPSITLPRSIAPPTTTTTTTTAPASTAPPSTAPSSAITDEGSPASTAGLVVFGVVVAVLVGGAAVLYLRHRRPG
ncbi:DUF1775 domain-containing protein [Rhabdothermincola sediminis]|uniref:DUF1775 domain-containing protein n=1 Tax=Rhabdothermincola sediminis TaxID=2751370 RepID=UPI001AA06FCD|nr:DUF1775 domain-containing protein [Rhabdothermincola sediminis]